MNKVGIIGFGKMGKKHFDCYKRIKDVDIIGAYDVDLKKVKDYGVRGFEDYKELIEQSDIISICTPTDTHKLYIIECIMKGKSVFVEKPLCRTMNEGDEIAKLVKKFKAKIMVGHIVRYFNQYISIKNLIDKKSIGNPVIARITRSARFKGRESWFSSFDKSGGVILDLMIHDIDFLRWCFGDVKRVYAKSLSQSVHNLNMDYALAILRFKNGVIAHLESSWVNTSGFRSYVEICGDKGLLSYDSKVPTALTLELNSGEVFKENPVDEDANLMELEDFINYVRFNKKPRVTFEDAYNSLKVALSALESSQKDCVVEI
jgi:predicted dehydrogenase